MVAIGIVDSMAYHNVFMAETKGESSHEEINTDRQHFIYGCGSCPSVLRLQIGIKRHEIKIEIEIITALPDKLRAHHFAA